MMICVRSVRVAVSACLTVVAGLATPFDASADEPMLVVNKQVGDIRMGESEAEVGYSYGPDCISGCAGVQDGVLPGLTIFRYKLHGGIVRVGYHRERVVYLETNSGYYRTADGLGVGSQIPFGKSWRTFRWHRCSPSDGYWVTPGRLATQLNTVRGRVRSIQIWSTFARQEC
jgi:hypothetical protein